MSVIILGKLNVIGKISYKKVEYPTPIQSKFMKKIEEIKSQGFRTFD